MNKPVKSDDVPATKKMLDEVRSELKSDITSFRLEVKADFKKVDSKFNSLESKIEALTAAVHRTNAIVEEQNARNKVALDGYSQVYEQIQDLKLNKADKIDTL